MPVIMPSELSREQVDALADVIFRPCSKCGDVKPLSGFNRDKRYRLGRVHQCRECQRENSRRWREENADRIREYVRQYYAENVDRYRELNRQYRAENADRKREYDHQYRAENADRIREYTRRWKQENPDKKRANKARYRALKLAATVEKFTAEDAAAIWGSEPTCVYCESAPAEHNDHFVPLARGGQHSLTNATWPACAPCNIRKRDRHPFEFIAAELMTEDEQADFLAALRRLAS